jgi:hypothetical protein
VVDQEGLVAELTGLTRVFGKPFALKSMILNYNIPFLEAIFAKALFVQIKRDPWPMWLPSSRRANGGWEARPSGIPSRFASIRN